MGFLSKVKAWFARTFPSTEARIESEVGVVTKIKAASIKSKINDDLDLFTAEDTVALHDKIEDAVSTLTGKERTKFVLELHSKIEDILLDLKAQAHGTLLRGSTQAKVVKP